MPALEDLYPGSAHVRDFGLAQGDDDAVWSLAGQRGFIVVSKDDDYHHLSFLYGPPPKVIWLRLGNCTTAHIKQRLRERIETIAHFDADPDAAFLELW